MDQLELETSNGKFLTEWRSNTSQIELELEEGDLNMKKGKKKKEEVSLRKKKTEKIGGEWPYLLAWELGLEPNSEEPESFELQLSFFGSNGFWGTWKLQALMEFCFGKGSRTKGYSEVVFFDF